MKKYFLYITFLCFLMTGFASCGDNTDFWGTHALTDAEIAEMARLDSIKNAQKYNISANLILNYTAEITISQTAYDGVSVTIDMDKIATKFGITKAELLAGIGGETGALDIKGFAIEGSTREDNGTSSNTNSTWGHWWNATGDVTTWGTDAMLYAEFDTETESFYVGQYPAHLTDGQTIQIIEALKYNDIRVAIVINVTAKTPGAITAPIVRTQNLTLSTSPKTDYTADSLVFDVAQAMNDLGVTAMSDVKFIGVNSDGSYTQETVTNNGFWYGMDGYVGSWGDNASVFTDYGDFLSDKISIGQYPGHLTEGQTLTIKYGMLANNKIVMLNITINVVAYSDPETAPTGDPVSSTESIALSKAYSSDYASVSYDVKNILRNAFKKTTYQIHSAITLGELKLYQGEVTSTDPTYTADTPGFWLKSDGTGGEEAESIVWLSLGHSETTLYLYGGNHPTNAASNTTVTTKLIAAYNGVTVTFNVTFNVQ